MQVPKGCLSAQMPIVLKQVNNGKCLSALLATINICQCSGNAVTQSRNRLLFALSPVQWTKNTRRRHSGATGVRYAQISITPIRQSCPTDQHKEFYPAILCWNFIYIYKKIIFLCFLFCFLKEFLSLESRGKSPGATKGGEATWVRWIC